MQPGRSGGDQAYAGPDKTADPVGGLAVRSDRRQRRAERRPGHAEHESQQQDDAGQRHPPLAREEFGEQPGRRCGQRAAEHQLQRFAHDEIFAEGAADGLADPDRRQQHDHRADGDENVVEPGNQAKMLGIGRHLMLHAGDMAAQCGRRLIADCARFHGGTQICFTVHG